MVPGKPANGRSLMKVVALGVKKGHRLRFTAQGEDAQQALDAIGEAIAAGLWGGRINEQTCRNDYFKPGL